MNFEIVNGKFIIHYSFGVRKKAKHLYNLYNLYTFLATSLIAQLFHNLIKIHFLESKHFHILYLNCDAVCFLTTMKEKAEEDN